MSEMALGRRNFRFIHRLAYEATDNCSVQINLQEDPVLVAERYSR